MACCRCRPRGQQGRGTVGDRQPVRRCLGLVRSQAAGLRTTSLSTTTSAHAACSRTLVRGPEEALWICDVTLAISAGDESRRKCFALRGERMGLYGTGYRQVVQSGQGLRLHLA